MRTLSFAITLVAVFVAALCLFLHFSEPEKPQAQDQIYWSGYTWQVRPPGVGLPGPNRWDNTTDTVSVNDDGSLELMIAHKDGKWVSGELMNTKSLGYGIYRWEIASDLSKLDPNAVLGLFTYDQQNLVTHNEIDIESTRWGKTNAPSGWVSYWISGSTYIRRSFTFTDQPPYQAQFQWRPGQISYYVSDRTGRPLIDVSFNELIPKPGQEVATVNLWRFRNRPPVEEQSVRITKFTWEPLPKDN